MYRYHVEVTCEDGSVYVYSVENLKDLHIYLPNPFLHGAIELVTAERDYYDSPVGINNQ